MMICCTCQARGWHHVCLWHRLSLFAPSAASHLPPRHFIWPEMSLPAGYLNLNLNFWANTFVYESAHSMSKVDKVLDQFWLENLDLKLKVCHEILFEVLFLHLNSSFCDKSSVKLHITVTRQKDRITFSPSSALHSLLPVR